MNGTPSQPIRAGVIGVGSMGENHARVYSELQNVDLACVTDHDEELAQRVADAYATDAVAFETALERCDVVTVAVPTRAHYDVVSECLNAGVHVLVEKPIAETTEEGRALAELAEERGLVLQVGHIERFNPAVQTVTDLVEDLDVISVEADRLGPPLDRTALGNVVFDLMVHDLDIVAALLDDRPDSVTATGTEGGQYATATLEFDDVVASLTASRVTQKKVRTLTVTARECLVEVDYLEQSVLIHRDSYPEYLTDDGKRRYRHESVVERPRVDNGEPLRHELEAFVEAARNGSEPVVTAEDGIRALEIVQSIDSLVTEETEKREVEA
ncbi:oxidoreductase domain protein (plasmid) [Haloterrigena turkmenica DSM 5511]|uniref:Oxidoreductase domain protein n=1 Tax=Haloterrigena turkmenica (strain ATCC 51198 / DSM 5511 / JCM 9101 / NCIMB 13204 / VKM B-1734 / 4k) TaxID=543526 RepID=D2S365_HALTV|nr:Gfo/Idh/MocA family oxidoreductase [Haloterrigena turkmenica]ADB63812.1 oxidoreductase domain protein [Haloterrigena turkmenica DSM 5511]